MTERDLVESGRFLLHDTDRVSATGSHFFSDDSIAWALTDALAVLVRDLVHPREAKTGNAAPRTAHISVAPLAATASVVWSGASDSRSAALPDDFYMLEAGVGSMGYVPCVPTGLGESIAGTTTNKLYVISGRLYGPEVTTIYYFRRPPTIKGTGRTVLPLLADAVYHTAKFAACRDLIVQHSKAAWWRWSFFENEYQTQKGALQ